MSSVGRSHAIQALFAKSTSVLKKIFNVCATINVRDCDAFSNLTYLNKLTTCSNTVIYKQKSLVPVLFHFVPVVDLETR